MTRLPFDLERACPKCTVKATTSIKYCKGTVMSCPAHPNEQGEHLHRTCQTCGYVWAEDCADAEEDKT